jgi:hypothetical protein
MNKLPLSLKSIKWVFRCFGLLFALIETFLSRNGINPDARVNLELARAFLHHDWAMTVNTLWQPLYPWLLALTLVVTRPSLRWEFPVAHFLNFVLFLLCLVAFEFFWHTLLENWINDSSERTGAIPQIAFWVFGYSLFLWLGIGYTLAYLKPDLLVLAIVLAQAGLYLRLKSAARPERSTALWFGVLLGAGYLTKAILFPVAFVFLGFLLVSFRSSWRWRPVAIAALAFLAISIPEITALSLSKGRLTYADTGRLNLAWHNYDIPYRHWQGGKGSGIAAHPTRKIYDQPAVYEFNGPIRASYPPWFDASYWNEGLAPKFNLGIVARHAAHNLGNFLRLLVQPKIWTIALLLILLTASAATFSGIWLRWDLILLSVSVFLMYCLTSVEPRYFPPWQLLFWGSIIAGIRMRPRFLSWTGYHWLAALTAIGLLASMANGIRGQLSHGQHDDAVAEYLTAEGLASMRVMPGTKVAAIGFDNDAYFAYLDQLSIVAEIDSDETCKFWEASPAVQSEVLGKLRQAGVQIVVANTGGGVRSTSHSPPLDIVTCAHPGEEWRQIEGSANRVYFLQ